MKITVNDNPSTGKLYRKGETLKPDWFYQDRDGDLVITDWNGKPACVVKINDADGLNGVFNASVIEYPLRDTKASRVTVAR